MQLSGGDIVFNDLKGSKSTDPEQSVCRENNVTYVQVSQMEFVHMLAAELDRHI